jgi:hypothetical protein
MHADLDRRNPSLTLLSIGLVSVFAVGGIVIAVIASLFR